MGTVLSYSAKENLSRLSRAAGQTTDSAYAGRVNASRLSGAAGQSTETPYTNRVNVSRLSGVNADAFVRNASLLSRLGGESELSAMVRFFYGKALHNPLTNKLFDAPDAVTLEGQLQQQIAFLKSALSGADVSSTYAGLASLGLSHAQFDAVVESVVATLRSQNVPPTVIDEVGAYCEAVRASVVR